MTQTTSMEAILSKNVTTNIVHVLSLCTMCRYSYMTAQAVVLSWNVPVVTHHHCNMNYHHVALRFVLTFIALVHKIIIIIFNFHLYHRPKNHLGRRLSVIIGDVDCAKFFTQGWLTDGVYLNYKMTQYWFMLCNLPHNIDSKISQANQAMKI